MSYIPDCRSDENYNEENLNDQNREFLDGFDWCVEMAVDNFFDNHFDGSDDTYLSHVLREKYRGGDSYQIEFKYGDREPEERKIETYADLLRSLILDWVEMERDVLITSMIDGQMSDDEESGKNVVSEPQ